MSAFSRPDAIVFPKASNPDHVRQNRAALDLALTSEDLAALETLSSAPKRKTPLSMI